MDLPTERHTRPVTSPRRALPAGAWDCHAHIFGPFDRFPLLPNRRWSPPLSPAEDYLSMLDTVGFAHGVTVHSWVNGFDNSGTASAFPLAPQRVRSVAAVRPDCDDAHLQALHAKGFRAIRFTEIGRQPVEGAGSVALEDLPRLAPRMKALGWQAHLWVNAARTLAAAPMLRDAGIPVVLDHMGYFDVARGAADAVFQDLLRLLRDGDFWVKLCPVRVTQDRVAYADVRPFHDALVEAIPDRLIYGTDWPFISLDAAPPDAGKLVDLFDSWTGDEVIRRKVFEDNPLRLFGA